MDAQARESERGAAGSKKAEDRMEIGQHPIAWYTIAWSSEVKPGQVVEKTIADQKVVIFRSESGKVSVVDAYCPHLGANFAHGGTVEGEDLRCPFHGFKFNHDGACVATGYDSKPPPAAKLYSWPVHETHGMIVVYYHPDRIEPDWNVPEVELDGWSKMKQDILVLKSHPQEISENSVDIGHFVHIHGYEAVKVVEKPEVDGPVLRAKYAMELNDDRLPGNDAVQVEFQAHVLGLGYSVVDIHVPVYGMRSKNFVMPMPTSDGMVELRLGMLVQKIENPGKFHPAMKIMPKSLATSIILAFSFKAFVAEVKSDFIIWENKRWIDPPPLAEGDGPIGIYRKYCKQFYTD